MRARITLAVVAILALALAIAGVVSALLLRSAARTTAQQQVLGQTEAFVSVVSGSGPLHELLGSGQSTSSEELLTQVLQLVKQITGTSTGDLVVTSDGSPFGATSGTPIDAAQRLALARCQPVSGLTGNVAYAAAPLVCDLANVSATTGATPGAAGGSTSPSAASGATLAGSTGATSASAPNGARHHDAGARSSRRGHPAASGRSSPSGAGQLVTATAGASSAPSSAKLPATVAIVLQAPVTYPAESVWYFVLAAAVALVVAGTVAALIARRISRHVVAAAGAAEAIAGGNLGVRLPQGDHAYPELVALGSAINTMASGLSRARALERQFLLSISHDLRTPLTSIRGYSEAIADGAVPDPTAAARVVMAEAARLERLIRDLLDLAYLDAQQFSLHPAWLDLGAAVGAAAEALRYELEAATVSLEVHQPAERLLVSADGDRVAQIVANLVENAGKYARSQVVVSIGREVEPGSAGSVAVSVEDDGPGIAAEDLPHIFERLYTSDRRPSRAARGTGLGLAIVAELAHAMGGSVSAESPIGSSGGTRMVVRLPLHEPPVPAARVVHA